MALLIRRAAPLFPRHRQNRAYHRICLTDESPYYGYDYWIFHDKFSTDNSLKWILMDVKLFLDEYPNEVVIVDFHEFPNGFGRDTAYLGLEMLVDEVLGEFNPLSMVGRTPMQISCEIPCDFPVIPPKWPEITQYDLRAGPSVRRGLSFHVAGNYIFRRNTTAPTMMTLAEVIRSGQRALLTFQKNGYLQEKYLPGVEHIWANTDYLEILRVSSLQAMPSSSHSRPTCEGNR